MNDDTQEVHDSPLPDQAWSALRSVILAVTAFALGRHWIEGDIATLVGTLVGVVAPLVVGQLKVRKRATQLADAAKVPETNLTLKGSADA